MDDCPPIPTKQHVIRPDISRNNISMKAMNANPEESEVNCVEDSDAVGESIQKPPLWVSRESAVLFQSRKPTRFKYGPICSVPEKKILYKVMGITSQAVASFTTRIRRWLCGKGIPFHQWPRHHP